jgi:hypothetical protein
MEPKWLGSVQGEVSGRRGNYLSRTAAWCKGSPIVCNAFLVVLFAMVLWTALNILGLTSAR